MTPRARCEKLLKDAQTRPPNIGESTQEYDALRSRMADDGVDLALRMLEVLDDRDALRTAVRKALEVVDTWSFRPEAKKVLRDILTMRWPGPELP